jgi:hypothetical protein
MKLKEVMCIFCGKPIKRCKCKPRPTIKYEKEDFKLWGRKK